MPVLVFDGAIAGLGSTAGVRLVVGMWPRSPFGPFTDVMVQEPDGRRTLVAPTAVVADFVASTYTFDAVRVEDVRLRRESDAVWRITAAGLDLWFVTGRRQAIGRLLRLLPRRLAGSRAFATLANPVARVVMPGVRTRGTAGRGRREWYAALDVRPVLVARMRWRDRDLGQLRPIDPPVGFGFGSTPARPSWVRVRSHVLVPDPPAASASAPGPDRPR